MFVAPTKSGIIEAKRGPRATCLCLTATAGTVETINRSSRFLARNRCYFIKADKRSMAKSSVYTVHVICYFASSWCYHQLAPGWLVDNTDNRQNKTMLSDRFRPYRTTIALYPHSLQRFHPYRDDSLLLPLVGVITN
ncbi:hypothetical protein BH10BAC4_BH10BAC4_16630 [soil metagenome]